jgi:orotate phosphoribosyltransferase
MIKHLQNAISDEIGLDSFDAIASVPTGGLVIASALALETVKPLVYVRSQAKSYGTGKLVEGVVTDGMKVLVVDDVATTGGSVINGIRELRKAGAVVSDAYVIVNRLEGAQESLGQEKVKLHHMLDVLSIAKTLADAKLIDGSVLDRVQKQVSSY